MPTPIQKNGKQQNNVYQQHAFPAGKPEQLLCWSGLLFWERCTTFQPHLPVIPISFLRGRRGSAQGIGPLAFTGFAKALGRSQTFWFLNQMLGLERLGHISKRYRRLQSKGSPDTMNCWKRRTFYLLHCYCDSVKLLLGLLEISPNFNFPILNGESVVKDIKSALAALTWQKSGV